ncbi:hypothetical protein ABIE24_000453 [Mycetocola sp. 2940]
MEREIAATRTGTTAHDGAVAQVDVTGLIATAFDHFDSRAGDPHLHTRALGMIVYSFRRFHGHPLADADRMGHASAISPATTPLRQRAL